MALAYLVMAHAQPALTARLVRRISHPEDVVVVHLDRKADTQAFTAAFAAAGVSPVLVRRRIWVAWGGWSYIRAVRAGIRTALRLEHSFTHLVLLSGADYPIRPAGEIREFFAGRQGQSFLSWSFGEQPALTDAERRGNVSWSWSGDLSRLLTWKVDLRGRRWHFPNATFTRAPRRRIPRGLVPAQGSAWWSLSRDALIYTERYLRRRPGVRWFFRFVIASDENLFQMVLLASPLKTTLVNEDLRFMHWAGIHPPTLTIEDVPEMVASSKLFARKFDEEASITALDELDRLANRAA